jgi:hypothetical protein
MGRGRTHANSSAFSSSVRRSSDLSVRRHGFVVGSDMVAEYLMMCFSTRNEGATRADSKPGNNGGRDSHEVKYLHRQLYCIWTRTLQNGKKLQIPAQKNQRNVGLGPKRHSELRFKIGA